MGQEASSRPQNPEELEVFVWIKEAEESQSGQSSTISSEVCTVVYRCLIEKSNDDPSEVAFLDANKATVTHQGIHSAVNNGEGEVAGI